MPSRKKTPTSADYPLSDPSKTVQTSASGKVKVAVTDIDGVLRGKYLHKDKFLSAVDGGFGFCNVVFGWDMTDSVYDNAHVIGWQHGFPDVLVQLDMATGACALGDKCRFSSATSSRRRSPLPTPAPTAEKVIQRAEAWRQPMCGLESNGNLPRHRKAGPRKRSR